MSDSEGNFIHLFCGYSCEEVSDYRWTTSTTAAHPLLLAFIKMIIFIELDAFT